MALDIEYYERELDFYRKETARLRKQIDELHERELASLREKLIEQKALVAGGEKVTVKLGRGEGGGDLAAFDILQIMAAFLGTIGGFFLIIALVAKYVFGVEF